MALRVPVEIQGIASPERAATVVVNDDGALLLSPTPSKVGELLTVRNLVTGRTAVFRVTTPRPRDVHLKGFPIGVAMVEGSARDFWGVLYGQMLVRAQKG